MYLSLTETFQDLLCAINLQHDCHRGKCQALDNQEICQEREITSLTRLVVKHTDDNHFIVNVHSLHNYQHIAAAIPLQLRQPTFHVDDEMALHNLASAQVRDKKHQQTVDKTALLMAKVMGRASIPTTLPDIEAPREQLLDPLGTDEDLIDLLQEFIAPEQLDDDGSTNTADTHSITRPAHINAPPPANIARAAFDVPNSNKVSAKSLTL